MLAEHKVRKSAKKNLHKSVELRNINLKRKSLKRGGFKTRVINVTRNVKTPPHIESNEQPTELLVH